MTQIQLIKTSPTTLTTATTEASEFLQSVKTGVWLNCDIRQARNYLFHKRFFALLNLGFQYWTPTGGTITQAERDYLRGCIRFMIELVGQGSTLQEIESVYNERTAQQRANGHAVIKSFEAYRKWVIIEAGFYDEFALPDNTIRREARSISFAKMEEGEFRELYKAVFNVLWNHILFKSFLSRREAEAVAMPLLELAA